MSARRAWSGTGTAQIVSQTLQTTAFVLSGLAIHYIKLLAATGSGQQIHAGERHPAGTARKARTLLPGSTIALTSHSGDAVLGTLGMTHWLSPLTQAAEMAIASQISAALLKRSQYGDPVVPRFKLFAHVLQIRALKDTPRSRNGVHVVVNISMAGLAIDKRS